MKKVKKVFTIIGFIFIILGFILCAIGFFTGGTPSNISQHGNLTPYLTRLNTNYNILGNDFQSILRAIANQ